jgi:2-polyprenyl-6-methoxyphenol hydroxylase-like FAD-dependent oxidoreductase
VAALSGLLPALERIHYGIANITVVDADGQPRYSIDYPTVRRLFGGRHYNFLRGDLERVLFDYVQGRVDLRFGVTVDRFEARPDGVDVALSDGRAVSCDALVGADGFHSRIRTLQFGDGGRFVRSLGYHAAAFILEQRPAELSSAADFTTLSVPGRQVAVYPIRGDRLATFFLHRSSEPAPRRRLEQLTTLRQVYGDLAWIVPKLLDGAERTEDLYFDSVDQVELPEWSQGRVGLVGDACQCVSLLAGQGASLAMAGGYHLAQELHRSDGSVAEGFARYARKMQESVRRKQKSGRRLAGWFLPESRFGLTVRDAVTRMAVTRLGGWLVRRQLAGDNLVPRPDAARGRA